MMELVLAIADNQPVQFNVLQKETKLNTLTLQRRLEDLKDEGFLKRVPCKKDKRHVYYLLAEEGEHVSKFLSQLRTYLLKIS